MTTEESASKRDVTRTTRFEIKFVNPRLGEKMDAGTEFHARLFGVMRDLRTAAVHALNATWLAYKGLLPWPQDAGANVHPHTAMYQCFSGKWQPYGEAMYIAKFGPAVSGGVRSATANVVHDRIKTDMKDVLAGKQALPTFKKMPIYLRASEIAYQNERIYAGVFAKATKLGRVVFAPRKLDASLRAIVRRIASGEYKRGNGLITYDAHRKKWFFSQSYTMNATARNPASAGKPVKAGSPVVAGVDVGLRHAAWISYLGFDGEFLANDVIPTNNRILRSIAHVQVERRQRSAFNRVDLEVRAGRGRSRKLRATEKIGHRVANLTETLVRDTAALVVKQALHRGATLLVVEEHLGFAEDVHRKAEIERTRREAAEYRKNFFKLHAGALRDQILSVAAREGIEAVKVAAQWTSRACSKCGLIWKRTGMYATKGATEAQKHAGRYNLERFYCSPEVECDVYTAEGKKSGVARGCGYAAQADHNAAINIARLGLRKKAGETDPALNVVNTRRKKSKSA